MSLVGVGMDIVAVERLAELLTRHGDRFLTRCFRNSEPGQGGGAASLAGRWAAKEAFLKALGTDVKGIPYRDIEVARRGEGPDEIFLHGLALDAMATVGADRIHLTIGHERGFALGLVLIEGTRPAD